MKLIKATGAISLLLAGYLIHGLSFFDLSAEGAIILGVLTLSLIALGLSAIFAADIKSFKQHIKDLLNGLPL